MITTSAALAAALKSDTEQTIIEADFGFVPPGAVEGSAVTSSAQASISRLAQVNDGVQKIAERMITLEPDRWLLDGSFVIADPDTTKTGFFSAEFCDGSGVFATPPYLDYTMDAEYSLIGIMVFWDEPCAEWATQCTVTYYNAAGAQVAQKSFDNDSAVSLFDLPKDGVKRIRLSVNAWNTPHRMTKIPSVLPGQIYYMANDIFSFEHMEHITLFDSALTLPEVVISFDNSSNKFDIVNPQGLIAYLRQKMRIDTRIKIKLSSGQYEPISMGSYYLYSWPENTQDDEASFTCRPSMAFAKGYYDDQTRGTQTVAQAAAQIFAKAAEPYTIDATLQSLTVNRYIGDKVPLISAMGQLAVACAGYWFIDRDGSYHLRKWQAPSVTDSIDYDNAWEKPTIQQRGRVTAVNVPYTTFFVDEINTYNNIVTRTVNDGEQKEINSAFIGSKALSDTVAAAALAYFDLRLTASTQYRGTPSLQAGDAVEIEHDYGTSNVMITDHVMTWDENGLDASVEGVVVG